MSWTLVCRITADALSMATRALVRRTQKASGGQYNVCYISPCLSVLQIWIADKLFKQMFYSFNCLYILGDFSLCSVSSYSWGFPFFVATQPSDIIGESSLSMEVCWTCGCLATTAFDQTRHIKAIRPEWPNGVLPSVPSQLATDVRCEEIPSISSQRTSVASCSLCCS
jgi:hypothetical protein